jgi:lysophospholipase L1-like esterase
MLAVAAGAGLVSLAAVAAPGGAAAAGAAQWVGSWGASAQQATSLTMPVTSLSNQTVRNIVYTTVGGNQLRIRLSNAFGHRSVRIAAASVGLQFLGAQVQQSTVHRITFSGRSSVLLPPGAAAISDPVRMRVPPLTDLAVSLYVPGSTGPVTNHSDAQQINYLAGGNHASDAGATAFSTQVQSWYLLDGLSVASTSADGAVVAFGDSITDGFQSQVNANDRWPNYLARRLIARDGANAPGVVDEGISGNRVLHNSVCFGINAQARFDRDVLTQPGARDVILLEGINDIGFSQTPNSGCTKPNTAVSAGQIIRGYEQLIARAHAAGLKIFGGTLTPFRPAGYWSPAAEVKREAVNHWILTSGAFDGVVDFAKAIAYPGHPQFMNPKYDSGDHLHPNDAGYEAMANAINLAMLG